MARKDRDSIYLEDSRVIWQKSYPDQQYILRVQAPQCAAHARAGSFAHVSCDPLLPMRRPLSIMQTDAIEGWVDFLYKPVGNGLALLAKRKAGDIISILGPIGQPFETHHERPLPLLIGGGVGIPPMVFLADQIQRQSSGATTAWQPVLFMGSEVPFPFELAASRLQIPGIDSSIDQNLSLIENWNIPGRLASLQGFPGCYDGYVTQLASDWLSTLPAEKLNQVEMFACGPTPMLKACAEVARRFQIPAQVSLEEHMACAVGGCAGCTVLVQTPGGPAMQRVCVDGPVFAAQTVFA